MLPVDAMPDKRIEVRPSSGIELSADLPPEAAVLVPAVATALRVWDLLRLELGTAAVVTPGPWAPLLSVVAGWYGAAPLIVGAESPAQSHGSDAEAVARLAATLAGYPAVCAVESTGRADMVDLLLESVPKYSRVLFAGPRGDRLTIDYYVNVHRKGLQLSSTVLSPLDAGAGPDGRELAARAARLLANPTRAAHCQAGVAPAGG